MEIARFARAQIEKSLTEFPVVLLTGPRQVGKTTLVRQLAAGRWPARHLTLDDPKVRERCLRDPDALLASYDGPLVLEEVQAAPDLLRAIRRRVDRAREPGMYILTGSANLLAMRQVKERLAGLLALHELQPLSLAELRQRPEAGSTVDGLFAAEDARAAMKLFPPPDLSLSALRDRILAGGCPTPALQADPEARRRWFETYVRTYVERDIATITGIAHVGALQRLLRLLMLRTGNLLNVSYLAREFGTPQTTLRRYVDLLEVTYQVFLLPSHVGNPEKRLVKARKVYGGDTGITAHLSGFQAWEDVERDGSAAALLETFVLGELRKDLLRSRRATSLAYWRTRSGREVDFVLQRGERVVGIEVKRTTRLGPPDLACLKAFAEVEPLHLGVILYLGQEVLVMGERVLAVPVTSFF